MSDIDEAPSIAAQPVGELHAPEQREVSGGGSINQIIGTITKEIGSGSHAQNSIVYRTIRWSFLAGGIFSLCVVGYSAFFSAHDSPFSFKDVWSVFSPIITLALGYLFGKGE